MNKKYTYVNGHSKATEQAHELVFNCYRDSRYFLDPVACEQFLEVVQEYRKEHRFFLWAYAIMQNHVHLLVSFKRANTDVVQIDIGIKGMVSERYSAYLLENDKDRYESFEVTEWGFTTFRLWQPGGSVERNISGARSILRSIKSIEANPVRKGYVEEAHDYQWCSAWARENKKGLIPDLYKTPVHIPDQKRTGFRGSANKSEHYSRFGRPR